MVGSDVLQSIDGREGSLRIGLLNFNVTEIDEWRRTMPNAELLVVQLDYSYTSITWDVLYLEWIDEEEEDEVLTANLTVASARGASTVYLLLLTECFPIPNLFYCRRNLVVLEGKDVEEGDEQWGGAGAADDSMEVIELCEFCRSRGHKRHFHGPTGCLLS
ncbi:hypothetical protein OPV22_005920 [Ensete ventricosum]|uniref:Uncharacterized protein n=1 Tax=Ensete ventricosum TaxID=4639 RepID=A0AAV8RNM1_ENSVE|nr:hypothetical protein OPV22_005920 [Ensete ventricosum]